MYLFHSAKKHQTGFSYIELTISAVIASMIMIALQSVIGTATSIEENIHDQNTVLRDSKSALQRMVYFVAQSEQLILPLVDNPDTDWPEHIREQTLPASAPIGSSLKASAVLAVTIPKDFDLDKNKRPDADDDGDGLIDEDLPSDMNNDGAPGIFGIDDDGDGRVDEESNDNDDEQQNIDNEEIANQLDDDNDGALDEDVSADMNKDGCSGICQLDDDGDGVADEDNINDDDEDGRVDEDPINPVVYYFQQGKIIERLPAPWDVNNDSAVNGQDFIENVIAENVRRFRIERIDSDRSQPLIHIIIESTYSAEDQTSLETYIRLGSGK